MTVMTRLASIIVALAPAAQAWVLPSSTTRNALSKLEATDQKNIVLTTSDDPSAFDSFKLGSARVHRYSREEDPDSETEYVMWYHGRSKALEDQMEKKLPPLSTGRIGRATSRNGLVWTKDTKGSVSEDMEGVSLGLNAQEWWGFDTTHVGLGNVLLPMTTPAVLNEGGVYLMHFMGGDHEERKVSEFVDRELPETMKDATIKGMNMKIGVAVSQDGITWGKVEGDDPTGACLVPYNKDDPNIDHRTIPKDMPEEMYCAWPDVVVNVGGGKEGFIMYYSTMTKDTKEKCIARAISEDGFRWFQRGVCVKPDSDGLDADGCARCCVLQNAEFRQGSWKKTKGYTMYYEGVSKEDRKHRIMEAVSRDGKTWAKNGVVFDVGAEPDAWDHGGVGSPHVIRMDDGTQRMYYTGQGSDGSTAIGVVKLTVGESVWEREVASFVLS